MSLVVVTIDAMHHHERERATKHVNHGVEIVPNDQGSRHASLKSILAFFAYVRERRHVRSLVVAYPDQLIDPNLANDERTRRFEDELRRAVTEKLGFRVRHVAVGIGGDVHRAFDDDMMAGRYANSSLEDAYARAKILNDREKFADRIRTAFCKDGEGVSIVWNADKADVHEIETAVSTAVSTTVSNSS